MKGAWMGGIGDMPFSAWILRREDAVAPSLFGSFHKDSIYTARAAAA